MQILHDDVIPQIFPGSNLFKSTRKNDSDHTLWAWRRKVTNKNMHDLVDWNDTFALRSIDL